VIATPTPQQRVTRIPSGREHSRAGHDQHARLFMQLTAVTWPPISYPPPPLLRLRPPRGPPGCNPGWPAGYTASLVKRISTRNRSLNGSAYCNRATLTRTLVTGRERSQPGMDLCGRHAHVLWFPVADRGSAKRIATPMRTANLPTSDATAACVTAVGRRSLERRRAHEVRSATN
jgi:hypothetical protein